MMIRTFLHRGWLQEMVNKWIRLWILINQWLVGWCRFKKSPRKVLWVAHLHTQSLDPLWDQEEAKLKEPKRKFSSSRIQLLQRSGRSKKNYKKICKPWKTIWSKRVRNKKANWWMRWVALLIRHTMMIKMSATSSVGHQDDCLHLLKSLSSKDFLSWPQKKTCSIVWMI